MAKKSKVREINIVEKSGAFNTFFKRLTGERSDYDYEGIEALRKLLSNERARIIHTIKYKHPKSIYELAKILQRDFKAVQEDIKLLERFGFIDLISEHSGKRKRLKPILIVDEIHIKISV